MRYVHALNGPYLLRPARNTADRISGSAVRMRSVHARSLETRVAPTHGCQAVKQSAAVLATVPAVTLFLVCNLTGREIYSYDVGDDVDI